MEGVAHDLHSYCWACKGALNVMKKKKNHFQCSKFVKKTNIGQSEKLINLCLFLGACNYLATGNYALCTQTRV